MKPIRLGIIGAESSHSWQIANICNKLKKVPMRVTHIWGESPEFAGHAAAEGAIPNIIGDWKELVGEVDGVMIAHRHGGHHPIAARYFLEWGIPTFVDKPIACALSEATELFSLADRRNVPLMTFTAKPLQQGFADFVRHVSEQGIIRVINATGPVEIDSKWGGIFFYGIHQVDAVIEILGTGVERVSVARIGENGVATLWWTDGSFATLNLIKDGGFHWRVCADKGVFCLDDQYDKLPYLKSSRIIANFVRTGEVPFSRERMLAPIAILEAMQKALKSRKVEPVASVKERPL